MKLKARIMYILKCLLNTIIEILFPLGLLCDVCKEHISPDNKYTLCKQCYESIEFLTKEDLNHDDVIKKLLSLKYYNDIVINDIFILAKYENSMTRIVQGLKYDEKTYLARLICELVANEMNIDFSKIDYISYVPIHKKRLYKRGFNQTKLIAECLGKKYNKELINIVNRVKDTKSLYDLSPYQRFNQMKDAFQIDSSCKLNGNESIIIVEDILTTGATIQNMALEIKRAYRNINIYILFVSRTSMKN